MPPNSNGETAGRRGGVDFRCGNRAPRSRDRGSGRTRRAIPMAADPIAVNLAAVGKIEPPAGEISPRVASAIVAGRPSLAERPNRTVTIGTVGGFGFRVRGNRSDGEPQGQPCQSCRFHMQTPVPEIILGP